MEEDCEDCKYLVYEKETNFHYCRLDYKGGCIKNEKNKTLL